MRPIGTFEEIICDKSQARVYVEPIFSEIFVTISSIRSRIALSTCFEKGIDRTMRNCHLGVDENLNTG